MSLLPCYGSFVLCGRRVIRDSRRLTRDRTTRDRRVVEQRRSAGCCRARTAGSPARVGSPGSRFDAVSSGGNSTSEFRNVEHACWFAVGQRRERVARRLRLAAVAQDHLVEIDAAAVVPVRRRGAHAPQRLVMNSRPDRAVVVALVEVRAEVVALEVGEDVPHDERLQCRQLCSVGYPVPSSVRREQRRRGREQAVEDAALGGSYTRLDVGDAPVARRSCRSGTWQLAQPICSNSSRPALASRASARSVAGLK